MTNNERDTHFAGFAKLLWQEVRKTSFDSPGFSHYQQLEKHLQLLFAQRAYDLVAHTLEAVPDIIPEVQSLKASLESIPDLTVWPSPSPPAETEHEP